MYQANRIIVMVVGFILAFLLFLVLAYFVYPVFNPDVKMSDASSEVYLYDYAQFGPQVVGELKKKADAFELELNEKRAKEIKDLALIDSLYQANLALEDKITELNLKSGSGGLAGLGKPVNPKVAEASKALLRLEEDELAPIVNRLSDNVLVELYNTTSGTQREKLLKSLEPAKAASLLRRVMS